eukprot:GILI01029501.1.p1 GENE.GILI01029501.1~~GILI01029501.1.p1  ORF type:complete len:360 (+),score=26.01 GILI01029501.1:238-1317(+)
MDSALKLAEEIVVISNQVCVHLEPSESRTLLGGAVLLLQFFEEIKNERTVPERSFSEFIQLERNSIIFNNIHQWRSALVKLSNRRSIDRPSLKSLAVNLPHLVSALIHSYFTFNGDGSSKSADVQSSDTDFLNDSVSDIATQYLRQISTQYLHNIPTIVDAQLHHSSPQFSALSPSSLSNAIAIYACCWFLQSLSGCSPDVPLNLPSATDLQGLISQGHKIHQDLLQSLTPEEVGVPKKILEHEHLSSMEIVDKSCDEKPWKPFSTIFQHIKDVVLAGPTSCAGIIRVPNSASFMFVWSAKQVLWFDSGQNDVRTGLPEEGGNAVCIHFSNKTLFFAYLRRRFASCEQKISCFFLRQKS